MVVTAASDAERRRAPLRVVGSLGEGGGGGLLGDLDRSAALGISAWKWTVQAGENGQPQSEHGWPQSHATFIDCSQSGHLQHKVVLYYTRLS